MQVLPQKKLTLSDIILITVLACAVICFFIYKMTNNSGDSFTITTPTENLSYSLSVNSSYEIESRGIKLTVTVSDGSVSVTSSDCPDHTCEHSGSISRSSEVIVCVPAGVVIKVISDNNGQVPNEDFIIG